MTAKTRIRADLISPVLDEERHLSQYEYEHNSLRVQIKSSKNSFMRTKMREKNISGGSPAVGEAQSTEFKYAASNIPKSAYEELARCFFPEITAYFESEEGKREYGIYLSKRNLH